MAQLIMLIYKLKEGCSKGTVSFFWLCGKEGGTRYYLTHTGVRVALTVQFFSFFIQKIEGTSFRFHKYTTGGWEVIGSESKRAGKNTWHIRSADPSAQRRLWTFCQRDDRRKSTEKICAWKVHTRVHKLQNRNGSQRGYNGIQGKGTGRARKNQKKDINFKTKETKKRTPWGKGCGRIFNWNAGGF